LTLVKSVLEGIHVYWLSLAYIPKGILKKRLEGVLVFLGLGKGDTLGQMEKASKAKRGWKVGLKKHLPI
jgi:hypothetical protein